jgi:hypothetical protein
MSYLSGYREHQHYENASSIPPFDVYVSTSPLPRVPFFFPPPLQSTLRRTHISSQRRGIALALRSEAPCCAPRFLSHPKPFVLSRYVAFDHVFVPLFSQTDATHRCRAGDESVR